MGPLRNQTSSGAGGGALWVVGAQPPNSHPSNPLTGLNQSWKVEWPQPSARCWVLSTIHAHAPPLKIPSRPQGGDPGWREELASMPRAGSSPEAGNAVYQVPPFCRGNPGSTQARQVCCSWLDGEGRGAPSWGQPGPRLKEPETPAPGSVTAKHVLRATERTLLLHVPRDPVPASRSAQLCPASPSQAPASEA